MAENQRRQHLETILQQASSCPANGLLSGMCLTWGSAVVVFVLWLLWPGFAAVFQNNPSPALLHAFMISALLMALHKIESYALREFDCCPVYANIVRKAERQGVGRALFVTFCSVFVGLLVLMALLLFGAPWPLLLFAVWSMQSLHEWHHAAKSLARGYYYPGTLTAMVFAIFQGAYFIPLWVQSLVLPVGLSHAFVMQLFFGLATPLVVMAFYIEDSRWLRQLFGQKQKNLA